MSPLKGRRGSMDRPVKCFGKAVQTWTKGAEGNMKNQNLGTGIFHVKPRLTVYLLGLLLSVGLSALVVQPIAAQTSSTGALAGVVTDHSGAVVPGARISVTSAATGQTHSTVTNGRGYYIVPLLPPGIYRVSISRPGFRMATYKAITINVTETAALNVQLKVGSVSQQVVVRGQSEVLQTQSAQMGTVTNRRMIESLPLVSRNYLQIISLNPGVSAEVTNAADLGPGSSQLATGSGGFSTNGGATNDNNFKMNGVAVNDNFSAGSFTGGVPIPNPDTLQEFKVVTTPYDASNGRNGGASVDVLTRTGSNHMHGSLFEYFRNTVLNANEWFANKNGQPKGVLNQNQFGGAVGGPILHNKLFYFGSYQGSRQRNGLSSNCATEVLLPPLTNDRSAKAIAEVFNGQRGLIQDALGGVGPAIDANAPNGNGTSYPYNINPVALKLMQMKLPNDQYLIPTPQRIDSTNPNFDAQGSASFSEACKYSADQYMANAEYMATSKNRLQVRTFFSNSTTTQTLPVPNQPGNGIPGFPYLITSDFRNISLTDTYTISSTLVNQAVFGFNRNYATNLQQEQFSWSDLGASVPSFVNDIPGLGIANIGVGGYGQDARFAQNTYEVHDAITWVHGSHTVHAGVGFTRNQTNEPNFRYFGSGYFPTFADFLLGLNANDNGTAAAGLPYSNEYYNLTLAGQLGRYYRYYDADAYIQDNYQATSRLMLNVGLRFEHLGGFSETQGRNTGLNLAEVNPNPPTSGTLAGFIVPSNYQGAPPAGVIQADNKLGIKGLGQNTFEPRVGFAWQLPGTSRFVLRGGYGLFRSRTGGNGLFQSLTAQPYSAVVFALGTDNAAASLQNPIPQPIPSFPAWVPYSPTTSLTFQSVDQNYEPSMWQHYSLDLQMELAQNLLLDVGYVGGRGTKLFAAPRPNEAMLASPSNPIRGQTTNTIANIPQRLQYEGWAPNGLLLISSTGEAWYNALQVSLNKRFSNGLQFLASYTWARDLTDVPGGLTHGGFGGSIYGDQKNLMLGYGPAPFVRPQRFVLSYLYDFPHPANLTSLEGRVLGGWEIAGVTTIQSGHRLFAVNTNSQNAFGVENNRPDYVPGCKVNKSGSIQSRLNSYFNTSCFVTPPVIGSDGVATALGDAPTGNIRGPSEVVFDFSVSKQIPLAWALESARLLFRSDFFNIMNHPVFNDPATDFGTSAFGQIVGPTIVSPRVIQFSLKLDF